MRRFRKLSLLGEGSYGSVYLAAREFSLNPSFTAVKSSKVSSSVKVSSLMREKKFLDELVGCPYIVQCFGDDVSDEKGQIVYNIMMEYAPGGTLVDLMKERAVGRIQESEAACYTTMLLHGLCIAHSKGIVHCDLKPDNVLVFPMEEYNGVLNHVVKIADFGLAKKVWEKEIDGRGRKSLNRGALLYASPEAVVSGDHHPGSDVWSLGCILMEMLSGHPTWGYCDSKELRSRIAFMEPEIPIYVSGVGGDFLRCCLEKDPHDRWTIAELLNHPFIEDSLRHFRGIEGMMFQMNPFGSTAHSKIRRRNTFSDFVDVFPYPGYQPCFPFQTIFESNTEEESDTVKERKTVEESMRSLVV